MELDGRAVEAWLRGGDDGLGMMVLAKGMEGEKGEMSQLRELKGSPRLLLVLKSGGPKGEDSDVL
jgi:hypothetical protein